jgi:hypothetical protein
MSQGGFGGISSIKHAGFSTIYAGLRKKVGKNAQKMQKIAGNR